MFSALSTVQKLARDTRFCLVTITETQGSTPRNPGAVMVVSAQDIFGSIGGGRLELDAMDKARKLLKTGGKAQEHSAILGPDMEQCCGGALTYTLEIVDLQTALQALQTQILTPIYLFGAGHVGTALYRALLPLPFVVNCFDIRPEKCTNSCHPELDPGPRSSPQSRGPGAEAGMTVNNHVPNPKPNAVVQHFSDPRQSVPAAPENTMFLIMTHDHNLDYELVRTVLTRNDFAFLGLIGSKTKRARFISRLKKDGFTDAQISRLTCPIGIDGIQGKEPEIIAASVAAQLLQIREQNGH